MARLRSQARVLWDVLEHAYREVGFDSVETDSFKRLVLARIIEPTSKLDSLRVLAEAGISGPSYPTLNRRLALYSAEGWREGLARACAAHAALGPATLVLYDVSTLYFETDQGDGFRESGFSNYAEVMVMPRPCSQGWVRGWSGCWEAVVRAA